MHHAQGFDGEVRALLPGQAAAQHEQRNAIAPAARSGSELFQVDPQRHVVSGYADAGELLGGEVRGGHDVVETLSRGRVVPVSRQLGTSDTQR